MASDSQQEFFLGALIGGAVGVVTALLLTPVSGSRLRNQITHGFGLLDGAEAPIKPRRAAHHKKASKTQHHTAKHHTARAEKATKRKAGAPRKSHKKAQTHHKAEE